MTAVHDLSGFAAEKGGKVSLLTLVDLLFLILNPLVVRRIDRVKENFFTD